MDKIKCYNYDGDYVDSLTQWDQGQIIYIDDLESGVIPNVHFAFQGNDVSWEFNNITSKTTDGRIKINIPNALMQSNGTLHLFFVYGSGTAYTTKYKAIITIKEKPKPDDYAYVDDGTSVSIAQLRTDINTLENTKITSPTTASVGYILVVKEIDEYGKPISWEAVDINTLI